MRTHSTLTLRTLILTDMKQEKELMTIGEIDNWVRIMPEITSEQFKHINFFVHSIFEKGMIRRQFRQMQSENTILLDAIDKYQDLSPDLLRLKTVTITSLMAVLDELMEFTMYADKDMRLPAISVRKRLVTVENEIEKIEAEFKKLKIDAVLCGVILEKPKNLVRLKTWSNEDSDYLKSYMLGILECLHQGNSEAEGWLRDFLYNNNHNSESFTNYLKERLRQKLSKISNINDRIQYLNSRLNTHRSRPSIKKFPLYDSTKAPIKDTMYGFMLTEISLLETISRNSRKDVVPDAVPTSQVVDPYKVAFSMSVDALAYFVKLMVTSGMIEAGVREQLIKYITEHFRTPGTSNSGIAAGSFRTKYKNVTQTTSVSVRASLMAMIKLIDKEF